MNSPGLTGFMSLCRFCVKSEVQLKHIFDVEHINEDGVNWVTDIAEMLICAKVEQNDGMPQFSCTNCISQFTAVNIFRQQCSDSWKQLLGIRGLALATSTFLQQISSTGNEPDITQAQIKMEPLDIDDDQQTMEDNSMEENSESYMDEMDIKQEAKDDTDDMLMLAEGDDNVQPTKRKYNKLDKDKPFQRTCEVCGLEFKQLRSYTSHKKMHTQLRPHPCMFCEMRFASTSKLKNHERTHTGERPFQCTVCERAFAQRSNLAIHMRMHTDDPLNKCQYCKKVFKNPKTLEEHLRLHTGERPYQCKHCDMRFATTGYLKNHERTHTGERPHKCDSCDKTFVSVTSLNDHKRIHTGERPFKCTFCPEAFMFKNHLTNHARKHGVLPADAPHLSLAILGQPSQPPSEEKVPMSEPTIQAIETIQDVQPSQELQVIQTIQEVQPTQL